MLFAARVVLAAGVGKMAGSRQEWTVRGIMRTMLPILAVLTAVELGSGLVLDTFEDTLLRYPSLLVLVPVTIGMAGNLGSVLAARLSTAFHLGLLSFSPRRTTASPVTPSRQCRSR